jgi:hypothetical protein
VPQRRTRWQHPVLWGPEVTIASRPGGYRCGESHWIRSDDWGYRVPPSHYVASVIENALDGFTARQRGRTKLAKLDDPMKSPRSVAPWLTGPTILENMHSNEEVRSPDFRGPVMDWTDSLKIVGGIESLPRYKKACHCYLPQFLRISAWS